MTHGNMCVTRLSALKVPLSDGIYGRSFCKLLSRKHLRIDPRGRGYLSTEHRVPSTEYQARSVVEMLLLQSAQQRRGMDPQDARGLSLVLAAGGEHLVDVVLFQFVQGEELVAGG